MKPKESVRDALVTCARQMDELCESFKRSAEVDALQSLRAGNPADAAELKQCALVGVAKSEAYKVAMKKIDELRQRIESGEVA